MHEETTRNYNEGFHRYLKNVHRIKSVEKGSLHECLQGVLFALYDWNTGPVDQTEITQLVVAIGKEFPFTLDLFPERSREVTSEGQ